MKNDIFEFNHIDSLLSEDEVKTLKEFYKSQKILVFQENLQTFQDH